MAKKLKAAKKGQDESTQQVYDALKASFPLIPSEPQQVVYRYNPVSIRVRVIDDSFEGQSVSTRLSRVRRSIRSLPQMIQDDITMTLVLTSEEAEDPTALLSFEFDDPTGSRL